MERDLWNFVSSLGVHCESVFNPRRSATRDVWPCGIYSQDAREDGHDYVRHYKRIKNVEIGLSALASSSLVLSILGDSRAGTIFGAFLSTVLLGLTLYYKEASLGQQAQKHSAVASKLWGVREQLLSLLIDMHDGHPTEEIRRQRDVANQALEEIYKGAPRTDAKAYAAAQRALKSEEDLYFSDAELDMMLPKKLRRTKI